jgi:hypothetical protein
LSDTGGVNGFYYRPSDIRKLLKRAHFHITSITEFDEADGPRIWITAVKESSNDAPESYAHRRGS